VTDSARVGIDAGFVPARAASVHTFEIDGEAVLLDEATNRLHHLNTTGALLWACFDGESTIGEIVDDLSTELAHPQGEVLADTLAVIRTLADEGLLAGFESARSRRWRRRDDVLWRRSLIGVVVLPGGADDPVALEGTGPELWDLLEAGRSLDDLAARLADQHGAEASLVATDIAPILSELEALGAIEPIRS